jgi:hypothetical protein
MPEEAIWIALCALVLALWAGVLLRFLTQSDEERQSQDEDLGEFLLNARKNSEPTPLAGDVYASTHTPNE